MILQGEFTGSLRRRSQKYYCLYNFFNGFSYMCLGETVILLLAMKLNAPDVCISILGCMLYLGYLILPLGKITATRMGAVINQCIFWVLRNLMALLIATSVLWSNLGYRGISMACLMLGAFGFYGFRAAGVVMSQPLVGNITTSEERPGFMAKSLSFFYISSLGALLFIKFLTHLSDSVNMLVIVIVSGATVGIGTSFILKNVDETKELMENAKIPLFRGMLEAVRTKIIRRQILADMALNIFMMLMMPMQALTLRRGYRFNNSQILTFTVVQFFSAIILAKLAKPAAKKYGSRKMIFWSYWGMLFMAAVWACMPSSPIWGCIAIGYLIWGGLCILKNMVIPIYFLDTVEPRQQVCGSIVISTLSGLLGGLVSSGISSLILGFAERFSFENPLDKYRLCFLLIGVIMFCAMPLVLGLMPVPQKTKK